MSCYFLFGLFVLSFVSFSKDENQFILNTNSEAKNHQLRFSFLGDSFLLKKQSLTGGGLSASYGKVISSRFRGEIGLSQTFGLFDGNVESFYSGIGMYGHYALKNGFYQQNKTHKYKNHTLASEAIWPSNVVYLAAGFQQYFLSGSSSTIPLTGFAVGGGYDFRAWDRNCFVELGLGYMTASSDHGINFVIKAGVFQFL